MRPHLIIVGGILRQDPSQVRLAQNDHMVDALAPNRSDQVMTIAGLWDEWTDKAQGETLKSCCMVITEPNTFVAEVHDRMPVILEAKDIVMQMFQRRAFHQECKLLRLGSEG